MTTAPPPRSARAPGTSNGTTIWLAALAACVTTAARPVGTSPDATRFIHEHVRCTVEARRLSVTGHYVFATPGSAGLSVEYPFPSDSSLGEPAIVRATAVVDGRPARVQVRRVRDTAVRMWVDARGDSCALTVTYRQPLLARRTVYRLTTARAWGRPLDRAVLEVDFPDSLGTPRFSMPFESIAREEGRTLFRFTAAPFWPDTDLVVSW